MGLELLTVEAWAVSRSIAMGNAQDAVQIGRVTLIEGKVHGEVADAQWAKITGELISQAEYARRRNVDPTTVRDAIKAGRVLLVDGKIHPDLADVQWQRNTRARAAARPAGVQAELMGGEPPIAANDAAVAAERGGAQQADAGKRPGLGQGYQDARTRREMAEAEQAEMKTQQLAGKLIDKERALRGVESAFAELRDSVMGAPTRAAPLLVGLADVRQIEVVIAAELRRSFEDFEARVMRAVPKAVGQ